jgi:hypothetical protein
LESPSFLELFYFFEDFNIYFILFLLKFLLILQYFTFRWSNHSFDFPACRETPPKSITFYSYFLFKILLLISFYLSIWKLCLNQIFTFRRSNHSFDFPACRETPPTTTTTYQLIYKTLLLLSIYLKILRTEQIFTARGSNHSFDFPVCRETPPNLKTSIYVLHSSGCVN